MKSFALISIGCLLLFSSCAPKISTTISKKYDALDYREGIRVYNLKDPAPQNAEAIGTIKIGDTGFSVNCGWDVVIEKAKMEARKMGANALKITKHNPPDGFSTCHRITATALKILNLDDVIPVATKEDSAMMNADYALLHVYRSRGLGSLISYDLHLGDTVICRVSYNWKQTVKITKEGLNTLWARTESREEVPIDIKFGKEYYLRCQVSMGAFVGRPKFELVDKETGKSEFQGIKSKKSDK